MIRSMTTAISALNLNQTFLDVISDNLANANTTGFKASRVIFQDQFAQIMSSGAAPIGNVGGINPTQIGLGVKLGYVSPTFTQGMMQSTGRSTDLAVQGNGFFTYTNGQETLYSREGSLEIDADGYLVNNSSGMRIMGWMIDPGSSTMVDTNQPITAMQISLDATIARATTTATLGGNLDSGLSYTIAAAPASVNIANIGSAYTASTSTPDSGTAELASGTYTLQTTVSGSSSTGYTYSSQLRNNLGTNVGSAITGVYSNALGATIDLGNGLTFTIDSGLAGDDAVPATLSTTNFGTNLTGSLSTVSGTELASGTYSIDVDISGTPGSYTYSAQLRDSLGVALGAPATGTYDEVSGTAIVLGNGITATVAAGLDDTGDITGTQFVYTHSILAEGDQIITSGNVVYTQSVEAETAAMRSTTIAVYDTLGASHTPTIEFTRTTDPLVWNWAVTHPVGTTGNGTLSFTTDGRYATSTLSTAVVIPGIDGADDININLDLSKITMLSADTTLSPRSQDGLAAGSVSELYGAPNTGEMYLVYSNGLKQLVGQLALAHFTNPSGLLRAGGNQYKIGLNSGEPQIGTANTGGRGAISSGYLEASNVDMAKEFTNMILAQRAFQASTRVITTSDQILQELVNLKQ
jgi:flagellar hook protein FlgE